MGAPDLTPLVAQVDSGDTAWMLTPTALVLLMTIGLGVFYAGLVRAKNTLNTFMMCVSALAIAGVGGFISPGWAMVLGFLGALPCYAVIVLRPRTRVDETLDVLAAHGIAGFTGILFLGLVARRGSRRARALPVFAMSQVGTEGTPEGWRPPPRGGHPREATPRGGYARRR